MSAITPAIDADPDAWPRRLITLGLLTAIVGSSAPIPLYPIFRQMLELNASTMTLIFVVYVFGALLALLSMGQLLAKLANPYRLLVPGLAMVAVAALLMAQAESLRLLLAGRFLAGLGTGAVTVAANVVLVELSPQGNARHAALLSSLSFGAGSSLGPILTGIALQLSLWPMVLPFVVIAASALLSLTVAARRWNSHRRAAGEAPAATAPAPAAPIPWAGFFTCAACIVASWSMGSTSMALGPFFGDTIFGNPDYATSGYVVSAYLVVTAISQWLHRRKVLRVAFTQGCVLAIAGLVGLGLAAHAGWGWLAIACMLVTAVGHGASFGAAAGLLNQISPPQHRSRLVSWFYTAGYLASLVPLGVGALVDRISSLPALTIYVIVIASLFFVIGILVRRLRTTATQE